MRILFQLIFFVFRIFLDLDGDDDFDLDFDESIDVDVSNNMEVNMIGQDGVSPFGTYMTDPYPNKPDYNFGGSILTPGEQARLYG